MLAVDVKNIKKTFKTSKQDTVEAVKDVSFEVKARRNFWTYLVQMVLANQQLYPNAYNPPTVSQMAVLQFQDT